MVSNAHCINEQCPEHDLAKSLAMLDPVPPVIQCGACGRPCEIREEGQ